MKDVARSLGVSVTSVSNAFSRPDRISAALRARIIDGAAELGYHGPDAAGRVLRSGRANAYGVVYNDRLSYAFTDPYAITLLAGFCEVVEAAGAGISLIPGPLPDAGAGQGDGAAVAVSTAIIDGVVGLCVGSGDPGIDAATRRGLPIVLTDASPDHDFVSIDDVHAGRTVARHIADLGHLRVAILFDEPESDEVAVVDPRQAAALMDDYRARGWVNAPDRVDALLETLDGREVLTVSAGRNAREHGQRAATLLYDLAERPTAIIATSDILALGVLDELAARGVKPGQDCAVAGFDGLPEALAVGLTTLVQPIADKGRWAARLLLDPELDDRQRLLPTSLHVGRTTLPA